MEVVNALAAWDGLGKKGHCIGLVGMELDEEFESFAYEGVFVYCVFRN